MKGPRTSRFEARRIAVAVLTLALPAAAPLHASPAKPPPAAHAPSVQVQTKPLERRALDATLTGYGIIATASSEAQALSVPSAAQLTRLLASPGQTVAKGTLLAELTLDPSAQAATQRARQAVDFGDSEVRRLEALFADRLATRSQVAAARKALADAQASLSAQQQVAGNLHLRLTAPFDGVVVTVSAAQGDRLAANAAILQVARGDGGRVLLGVEPDDSARVKPGMKVRLSSVFGGDVAVDSRVSQVLGVINPQTQLVDVVVALPPGSSARFMPGLRVRGEISLRQVEAFVVPRQAVLRDAEGWHVYQVDRGRARRVPAKPGVESKGQVAIDGPLNPGLRVVTVGNYELKDGMAVRETVR